MHSYTTHFTDIAITGVVKKRIFYGQADRKGGGVTVSKQIWKCKKSQLRLEGDARGRADKIDKGGKRDRTSSRENKVIDIFDPTDPGDDIFHLVFYFLCKVENNKVCDKAFNLQGVGNCWRNSTWTIVNIDQIDL